MCDAPADGYAKFFYECRMYRSEAATNCAIFVIHEECAIGHAGEYLYINQYVLLDGEFDSNKMTLLSIKKPGSDAVHALSASEE